MRRVRRKSDISSSSSVKLRPAWKTPEPPVVNRRASMPSLPLDKVDMLIMEANEITQYLQKDYLFARYDGPVVPPGGDLEALIKITNKKLGVSCVWTLTKLKQRLVKMRKLMYAGVAECSGIVGKSIYFDSNDEWTKSESGAPEHKIQPKVTSISKLNIRPLQTVPAAPVISNGHTVAVGSGCNGRNTQELHADTDYLPGSPSSGHNDSGLPDKYFATSDCLHDDNSRIISPKSAKDASRHDNANIGVGHGLCTVCRSRHVDTRQTATSMLTVCREMMTKLVDRQQDKEAGLVDKILSNCDSIKTAVINVLEFYTQVQETGAITAADFADSDLVRVTTVRLVAALELLVTHTSLWCTSRDDVESSMIRDWDSAVTRSVQELVAELVTFLQGCEQNNDTMAHGSASRVTDLLFGLVKQCGQLAAASNACPSISLRDPPRESIDQLMCLGKTREDALCVHPSVDLKQALLCGASSFTLTALQTVISTLEAAERRVEGFVKDCHIKCQNSEDIMRHVTAVVTKGTLLVRECHQVQVALDAEMKEDGEKSPDFFYDYFIDGQSLTRHVNTLADNLSLLIQAAQPLTAEKDCGSLKKVCRCADLVDGATLKLVVVPNANDARRSPTSSVLWPRSSVSPNKSLSMSAVSESKDGCVRINESGRAVNLATKTLVSLVQKHLTLNLATNHQRTRRMLPATPGGGARPLVRCQSARTPEKQRVTRTIARLMMGNCKEV